MNRFKKGDYIKSRYGTILGKVERTYKPYMFVKILINEDYPKKIGFTYKCSLNNLGYEKVIFE